VSGIAVTEATKRFIVKTPMDGGYMGNDLSNVRIGIGGLWQSHDTLSNAEHMTRKEVRHALMSIFIPISEGLRFPAWLRRLYEIYNNNLDVTTDDPEDNLEKKQCLSLTTNQFQQQQQQPNSSEPSRVNVLQDSNHFSFRFICCTGLANGKTRSR